MKGLAQTGSDHDRGEDWPKDVSEIRYLSTADRTFQRAMFYAPPAQDARPLLVALHSWSGTFLQKAGVPYARWCIAKGWIFIHPDFRGRNDKPEATGSEAVVADILSAVAHAKSTAQVDESRVYLVGVSGGGMASLLVAGRAPQTWTAVSSWVPIVDLKEWYFESVRRKQKYATDIVQSIGGVPLDGTPAAEQARKRSPLTYLGAARAVPIAISAGIQDGHDGGSVPVSHSLRAFNALADPKDQLTEMQIAAITESRSVPSELLSTAVDDPDYGDKKVVLRRRSRNVTLTLFSGGHEIIVDAALRWLAAQHR